MAVPKKKMSRSRTRRRKANFKVQRPVLVNCQDCNAPMRPHRACPSCGAYNGRAVVDIAE